MQYLSFKIKSLKVYYDMDYNVKNKLFKCVWPQCTYISKQKYSSEQHLLRRKSFICDFNGCKSSFKHNNNLKAHKKIHLGKKFLCVWPHCKFETKYKLIWNKHLLIHLEVKKFICDWKGCENTFTRKTGLNQHKLNHLGEKKSLFAIVINISENLLKREV